MNTLTTIIYILVLSFILMLVMPHVHDSHKKLSEKFGSTSPGALTQLQATDMQDAYLTDGYDNNIYAYQGRYGYYNPFGEMIWNNPTRIRSYYWPYLYYYPESYPWYYIYP
jgi:hypothetical protein